MVTVKVRAVTKAAVLLGDREQLVSLPAVARVSDLLDRLEKQTGHPLKEKLLNHQNHHYELMLFLNGRNIFILHGLNTELNDDDDLFFMPPMGGG